MNFLRVIVDRLREIRYHFSRNEAFVILSAGLFMILLGAFVYAWLEGWSLLDSLYATVITVTTVGYGDLSPQTAGGRLFAIFFTLTAVGVAGYMVSILAATVIERQSTRVQRTLWKRNMHRIEELSGHIVICGADFVGSRVALEYQRTGTPFILIEENEELLREALLLLIPDYYQAMVRSFRRAKDADLSKYESLALWELAAAAGEAGVAYLNEAPTDDNVLWRAGVERAAGLLATLPDDRDNLSVVVGARAIARQAGNDRLRIMSRVENIRNIRKLYFSGADEVRTPASIGGAEMALHMANPEVGKWWYAHLSARDVKHFTQVVVSQDKPSWIERSVSDIQAVEQLLILALKREGQYLSPPPQTTVLQPGDIAITYS
jgi:voltage-gated potassium channel